MNSILLSIISLVLSLQGYAKDLSYNVMDYGAVNNGKTISTKVIQKAIDDCADT